MAWLVYQIDRVNVKYYFGSRVRSFLLDTFTEKLIENSCLYELTRAKKGSILSLSRDRQRLVNQEFSEGSLFAGIDRFSPKPNALSVATKTGLEIP